MAQKIEHKEQIHYVPPRKGVDAKIKAYFESGTKWKGFKDSLSPDDGERNVCERCAGNHVEKDCISKSFVCHLCGEIGHTVDFDLSSK